MKRNVPTLHLKWQSQIKGSHQKVKVAIKKTSLVPIEWEWQTNGPEAKDCQQAFLFELYIIFKKLKLLPIHQVSCKTDFPLGVIFPFRLGTYSPAHFRLSSFICAILALIDVCFYPFHGTSFLPAPSANAFFLFNYSCIKILVIK